MKVQPLLSLDLPDQRPLKRQALLALQFHNQQPVKPPALQVHNQQPVQQQVGQVVTCFILVYLSKPPRYIQHGHPKPTGLWNCFKNSSCWYDTDTWWDIMDVDYDKQQCCYFQIQHLCCILLTWFVVSKQLFVTSEQHCHVNWRYDNFTFLLITVCDEEKISDVKPDDVTSKPSTEKNGGLEITVTNLVGSIMELNVDTNVPFDVFVRQNGPLTKLPAVSTWIQVKYHI